MKKPQSKLSIPLVISGAVFAFAAILLSRYGNPENMAFCIACFLRDIAGSLKLHTAPPVQYFRPEIVGILAGSFVISLIRGEYKSTSGSSVMIRFFLGFCMMIGALVFLGCPLRMVIRMAAGDLNAYVALFGFVAGVLTGTLALKANFSLGRTYENPKANGMVLTLIFAVVFALVFAFPKLFAFSSSGPASKHAPVIISLAIGGLIGAMSQMSRTCFAGGIRDAVLVKNYDLLSIIVTLFAVLLAYNLISGNAHFSFANQPVAHSQHIWNILGMYLVGLCAVLLGGCPLRQLVLAGQGSGDSAVAVIGMITGSAFAHNFSLASAAASATSAGGPGTNAKIVLIACIFICLVIAFTQRRRSK